MEVPPMKLLKRFLSLIVLTLVFSVLFSVKVSAATSEWGFPLPSDTYKISSGPSHNTGHYAIDIVKLSPRDIQGVPVLAMTNGTIRSGWDFNVRTEIGYGNFIAFTPDGYNNEIYFAHLETITISNGPVEQGQQIGTVGTTRGASGPHLHFEIRGMSTSSTEILWGRNAQSYQNGYVFVGESTMKPGRSCQHSYSRKLVNSEHEAKGHRVIYFCTKCGDRKVTEEWTSYDSCRTCYPVSVFSV